MSDRKLFPKLVPVPRRRILAYIEAPSFEGWKSVRDIPVMHGQTLADMVDQVNRCYHLYPDAMLIARAAKLVDKRMADLDVLEDGFFGEGANFVEELLDELVERDEPPEAS